MFLLNKHIVDYILNNLSDTYVTSKDLHISYHNSKIDITLIAEFNFDYKIIYTNKNYYICIKNIDFVDYNKTFLILHGLDNNLKTYCEDFYYRYIMYQALKRMLCLFRDNFLKMYQDCISEEYKIQKFCNTLESYKDKILRFYLKNKNVLTFK